MNTEKQNNDEMNNAEKAYDKYVEQLAKENGIPGRIISLLKIVDERYAEIEQLLLQIEDEAGITDLENEDSQTFYEAAWDYANEHGCMPFEELICILGQFHGRTSKDN